MDSEKLVRLTLAYNGEGFHGWQSQSDGSGIQDALERSLFTFLRKSVRVTSASRTDTGVHAEHQVVTFRGSSEIDLRKLIRAMNALLPPQVKVRHAGFVENSFHPIRSAVAKAYRYRVWTSEGITPFVVPFVWHNRNQFNIEAMNLAAKEFVGFHDFTTFCAADSSSKSKQRRVFEISIEQRGPMVEFWFIGEGFLKQMIRIIVGTLVEVGLGRIEPSKIQDLIAAKNRISAPRTAPAQGLCLVHISYNSVPKLSTLLTNSVQGYNLALDGEWAFT